MSAEEPRPHQVKLYVYDLTKGIARSMSQAFLGKQLDGIWHTSIVVFAREYLYGGGGIESCRPCGTILGNPDTVLELGDTYVDYPLFYEYISNLREEMFSGEKYDLFDHNCNTFSNEVAQFLTGNIIPEYITSLPQEVLDTPLGALIKPLMDSMTANPIKPRTNSSYLEPVPQSSYLQELDQPQPTGALTVATTDTIANAASSNLKDQSTDCGKDGAIERTSDGAESTKGDTVNGVDASPVTKENNGAISESTISANVPVVSKKQLFKDANPTECLQCIRRNLVEGALTSEEMELLEALGQYLDDDIDLTGIPKESFLVVGKLLQTKDVAPCIVVALMDLLQLAFLNLDVVKFMLSNDDPVMMTFVHESSSKTIEIQVSAIRMLCNICKWGQGFDWTVSDREWMLNGNVTWNSKITCTLVTTALFSQNMMLIEAAGTLVNNLAQHSVSEDIAIELGSALIQCIMAIAVSNVTEGAAFFCLGGLYGLMQHGEVTCLTSVMGLDPLKYASGSQRLGILCNDMLSVMHEN